MPFGKREGFPGALSVEKKAEGQGRGATPAETFKWLEGMKDQQMRDLLERWKDQHRAFGSGDNVKKGEVLERINARLVALNEKPLTSEELPTTFE